MKQIAKVLVGSRLHGIANEDSDYDYRGIFMHSIKDVISPFKKLKNTVWIEGDIDNTCYELSDFCKLACQGNPSILEVLWSDHVIESSSIFNEIKNNRHKFLDSKKIYEAHRGYSHNQSKKMNLFDPDERTAKYCIAYIRSLQQGISLLRTGEFTPYISQDKEFILQLKNNFNKVNMEELTTKFRLLLVELDNAFKENENKFEPDIEWVENFILESYMETINI